MFSFTFTSLSIETIITIFLAAGAVISGSALLIMKRNKKKDNNEAEAYYQKGLAAEYREQWLKGQENTEE